MLPNGIMDLTGKRDESMNSQDNVSAVSAFIIWRDCHEN